MNLVLTMNGAWWTTWVIVLNGHTIWIHSSVIKKIVYNTKMYLIFSIILLNSSADKVLKVPNNASFNYFNSKNTYAKC